MSTYSPARLTLDGKVVGNDDAVVLTPEEWLGKPFPLLTYVEIGADLSQGDWIVVLHRPECGKCVDVISRLTDMAQSASARNRALQIAFVRMPSSGDSIGSAIDAPAGIRLGHLRSGPKWIIQTPLVVKLHFGRIVEVESAAGRPRIHT